MARANNPTLVRGEETTPAELRDVVAYADAYDPLADDVEAMAQFVRFSTASARDEARANGLHSRTFDAPSRRHPESRR